jgi:hypothetical protein
VAVPAGVLWKLDRAARLTAEINERINGFLHKGAKPYRIDVRDDEATGERRYVFKLLEPPPAVEWAGMTGEVLHNLRSALDHLAYALCLAHAPSEPPPDRTEFPIFAEEERFDSTQRGGGLYKLRGMSSAMQAAIRAEQPFSVGERTPKAQSIWLLHEMSNIDKHRNLNLAFVPAGMTGFAWFEDPDVELMTVWSEEGVLAVARPRKPGASISSDPLFVPQVVFNEDAGPGRDRPVDVQLTTFVRIVGEIVGRLSQRFL